MATYILYLYASASEKAEADRCPVSLKNVQNWWWLLRKWKIGIKSQQMQAIWGLKDVNWHDAIIGIIMASYE